MLHISLAAETLWTLWGFFPVTNALLTTWIVMALLIAFAVAATRNLSIRPGSLQVVAESIVGGLYDFFESIAGKHIKEFFPIIATLFIYILVANWVGLLPGVGTIGFFKTHEAEAATEVHEEPGMESGLVDTHLGETDVPGPLDTEHGTPVDTQAEAAPVSDQSTQGETEFVPLLRGATADLNTTLALAMISVIAMQYYGFRNLGSHYLQRFVNFKDPILFGVGILEFVSDISKVVSFAFRLFGNIFAGEVLLAVIAFLMPFVVPLPFLFMELFVGVVQALVFSMLTAAFFNVAVSHE